MSGETGTVRRMACTEVVRKELSSGFGLAIHGWRGTDDPGVAAYWRDDLTVIANLSGNTASLPALRGNLV